jgi:hypothetical protein
VMSNNGQAEMRRLARKYRAAGYDVVQSRHWKVLDENGHVVTSFPATPSTQHGIREAWREYDRHVAA